MTADPLAKALRTMDAAVPHPGPGARFDPEAARLRIVRRQALRAVASVIAGGLVVWLWTAMSAATPAVPPGIEGTDTLAAVADVPSSRSAPAPTPAAVAFARRPTARSIESRRRHSRIERTMARAHAARRAAADAYARSRSLTAFAAASALASPPTEAMRGPR